MKKITTYIEGCVLNRSGYGGFADSVAAALIKHPSLDVKILSASWGSCPTRATTNVADEEIIKRIQKPGHLPAPELYVSIYLPHLHKPVGHHNISVSAGIETSFMPEHITKGANAFDLNILTSKFSKDVYLASKVTKPVEYWSWGLDWSVPSTSPYLESLLSEIPEPEAFLFVGQWTARQLFDDRKDFGMLLKTFLEAFADKPNPPALILKTSGAMVNAADRHHTLEKLGHIKSMVKGVLPSVYLLHGELSTEEMHYLMSHPKVTAHVSFTHAEGYGMPLLQASMTGKPILVPAYSGHLDFLDSKFIPLAGELRVIPETCNSEFYPKGSSWFVVDYEKAKTTLQNFHYGDRSAATKAAKDLAGINFTKFNVEKTTYRLHKIIDRFLKIR